MMATHPANRRLEVFFPFLLSLLFHIVMASTDWLQLCEAQIDVEKDPIWVPNRRVQLLQVSRIAPGPSCVL
jgi:hypothetical protein